MFCAGTLLARREEVLTEILQSAGFFYPVSSRDEPRCHTIDSSCLHDLMLRPPLTAGHRQYSETTNPSRRNGGDRLVEQLNTLDAGFPDGRGFGPQRQSGNRRYRDHRGPRAQLMKNSKAFGENVFRNNSALYNRCYGPSPSTSVRRNGSTIRDSISPVTCAESRCPGKAMTPNWIRSCRRCARARRLPGSPAVGMLGHRGPERQSVGDADEDSSLHGRRNIGHPHPPADCATASRGDAFARPVAKRTNQRPHLKPVPDDPPRNNPLSNLWRTATGITDAAARTVSGTVDIATSLLRPTPGSSLVGPVTAMRRYRAVRVPLADVEQVCRKFDVTINDVALAAITEGFRSVLFAGRRNREPDSLRTLVPVSVRSADALDKPGNRLSIMLPYLPVEEGDPIQQLLTVHSRLTRTKQGGQRQAGNMAVSATSYVPFMLSSWLIRLLTRLPQRGIVTLATNVPGPHRRLEMMGHKVARLLPIPPIALQLRTGVAIMSYADDLVFGITADYDVGSDIDELADGIQDRRRAPGHAQSGFACAVRQEIGLTVTD